MRTGRNFPTPSLLLISPEQFCLKQPGRMLSKVSVVYAQRPKFNPQNPHFKNEVVCTCNPSQWSQRQVEPWGLLLSQPSLLAKF